MEKVITFFKEQSLLIIEDHIDALNLMSEIMTPIFKEVYLASDGISAVTIYEHNQIDTIFCDIDLPKLNGFEVIKHIRRKDFNIPIIITSAYTDKKTLLEASNSSIQGFLEKPINFKDIKNTLQKIISQKQDIKNYISLNNVVTFNLNSNELTVDNENIALTLKEKKILNFFIKNLNKPLCYEEIENTIWTDDEKNMTMNSLRTLIKNIRKKLKYDFIHTVPKIGYKIKVD